jgi:hypothetical protein
MITAGAVSLGALYVLWGLFLAVMNLKQARDAATLPRAALIAGIPLLWVGYLLDFVLNVTLASLLFLEPPREMTLSKRFQRWSRQQPGRRQRIAFHALSLFLHPFDRSGGHRAGEPM